MPRPSPSSPPTRGSRSSGHSLRDEAAGAAEHAALRGFLAAHGCGLAELDAAAGAAPAGRSRAEVESDVTAWLRNRPKAQP